MAGLWLTRDSYMPDEGETAIYLHTSFPGREMHRNRGIFYSKGPGMAVNMAYFSSVIRPGECFELAMMAPDFFERQRDLFEVMGACGTIDEFAALAHQGGRS